MQADTQTLNVRLTWSDVVTGEGRELVAPLPVSFGRANDNTIALNSNKISRKHAVLRVQDSQVMLEDMQSTNGTYVNEDRITRVPLATGANFQIGPFHFIMTVVPVAAQPTPGQPSPAARPPARARNH